MQLNKYQVSYKIAGDYDLYLRAGRVDMIFDMFSTPLVRVEVDGVASTNPLKAYGEYLTIARNRLRGRARIVALLLIGIRAFGVILVKTLLPKRWVELLRGV